jgi:hypothetical protein
VTEHDDTAEDTWSAVAALAGGAFVWLGLAWAVDNVFLTILFWLSLVPIVLGALGFASVQFVQHLRDGGSVPGRFGRAMVSTAFALAYLFAVLLVAPTLRIG